MINVQSKEIKTEFSWRPWANTFLYYSFDWQNLNDNSWNNRNWSWYSWAWSFTQWIKSYWVNNWNRWIKIPSISFLSWDFTVSFRVKPQTSSLNPQTLFGSVEWTNSLWYLHIHQQTTSSQSSNTNICVWYSLSNTNYYCSEAISYNVFNHIVITKSWSTLKIYKNKNLIWTMSWINSLTTSWTYLIWNGYNNDRHITWVFDEVIIETKAWTQEEINKYYDKIIS